MLNFESFLILELKSNISDIRFKWYSDIKEEDFNQIIMSDPTTKVVDNTPMKMGKYSKWLLERVKKGELLIEDLYKAKEYLTLFADNKHLVKKAGLELDINKYKSINDIYDIVDTYQLPKDIKNEEQILNNKYYLTNGEAELKYEDETYKIVHTKTPDSNKFYGKDSSWCTIKGSFDRYKKDLYVIIDKSKLNTDDDKRRYQFHFKSRSFMDMSDRTCTYFIFKNLNFLKNIFKDEPNLEKLDSIHGDYINNIGFFDFLENFDELSVNMEHSDYIRILEKSGSEPAMNMIKLVIDKMDIIKNIYEASDVENDDNFVKKLIKILLNDATKKEVKKLFMKETILGSKDHGITIEEMVKFGYDLNNEKDIFFLITAKYMKNMPKLDLSKLDLTESNRYYIEVFEKIQGIYIRMEEGVYNISDDINLTHDDIKKSDELLNMKQIVNIILYMVDHRIMEGDNRKYVSHFKDALIELKRLNNLSRSMNTGMWYGIFEKKGVLDMIDFLLNDSKVFSFNQYYNLTHKR